MTATFTARETGLQLPFQMPAVYSRSPAPVCLVPGVKDACARAMSI